MNKQSLLLRNKIINFFKEIFSDRKKLAISIIFLAAAGFIGLRVFGSRAVQPQYQTEKVERGTIVSSVTASGKVMTANIINITTNASGLVKKVYVKDGNAVITSQKITEITLDQQGQQKSAQAWSSYLSAKNSVDSANATAYSLRSTKDTTWKKFYDLAVGSAYQNSDGTPRDEQRNSSSEFQSLQADWLAAEAKYNNQQAVIEQTKASLNNAWISYQLTSSVITAPISGIVSNVSLVEGMVLSSGGSSSDQTAVSSQRVAVIQNEASPILMFNITEIDVPKIKIGEKATITLDSLSGKTFTGEVVSVDRIGTVSSNVTNYAVIIRLDTTSSEILPNMAVTASIIIETKNDVLLVPSAAIQVQNNDSFVRVLKNGKAQEVSVQTGISSDTQIEIISGISEGDEVITGTVTNTSSQQRSSSSVFSGGGVGGGAFRPGGFGGGGNMRR